MSKPIGDAGAERRQIMYTAMGNSLNVCARPEFGEPKPIRLIYDNGHISEMGVMNPRDLLNHLKAEVADGAQPTPKMPVRIDKWWRSVGQWEPCWTIERGWQ